MVGEDPGVYLFVPYAAVPFCQRLCVSPDSARGRVVWGFCAEEVAAPDVALSCGVVPDNHAEIALFRGLVCGKSGDSGELSAHVGLS